MLNRSLYILMLLLAGCGGGTAVTPVDEVTAWTRSSNFTSCDQWTDEMTDGQREVMARELLPILRSTVDSAASGGEELAGAFASAITATCASDSVKELERTTGEPYVITAAATLAFLDTDRFQP